MRISLSARCLGWHSPCTVLFPCPCRCWEPFQPPQCHGKVGAQQQVRGHQDAEPSLQPGQAARYTSFMSSVQASSSPLLQLHSGLAGEEDVGEDF